jgi:hypothetical protein
MEDLSFIVPSFPEPKKPSSVNGLPRPVIAGEKLRPTCPQKPLELFRRRIDPADSSVPRLPWAVRKRRRKINPIELQKYKAVMAAGGLIDNVPVNTKPPELLDSVYLFPDMRGFKPKAMEAGIS